MWADWMIARLVNGVGTGILNAIVPVWATETAEHTSRGQFIAIEFTLNIFGVVVAYWLELYVFRLLPLFSSLTTSQRSLIHRQRSLALPLALRHRLPDHPTPATVRHLLVLP